MIPPIDPHRSAHPRPAAGAVRAYVGLGSNLGDPVRQILRAFAALGRLPASRCVARSSLYRSRPLGEAGQPDYINAVAVLETALPAPGLLSRLQAIEDAHGRVRGPQRWTPRTLDLDLLLYGDQQCADPRLVIPHPGLTQRDFVLYPLYEVEPGLAIPGVGLLRECLRHCPVRGLQRLEDSGAPATP